MIIICEPQCYGFEHAEVNAAFLAVIRYAFPTEEIMFLTESSHLDLVQEISFSHNITSIEYRKVLCPVRSYSEARRLSAEWKLTKQVFDFASTRDCKRLIFSSVTSAGLWCIKQFTKKYNKLSVTVIPHSILETVIKRPSLKPWNTLFWFRICLVLRNSSQLQYLVLGESIKRELVRTLPSILNYVKSTDLPYFFREPRAIRPAEGRVIKFGSLGVGHRGKGTDIFFQLAKDVHQKTGKDTSEFFLIGQIVDPKISNISTDVIIPSPNKPLGRDKFEEYADSVDYSVFCYNSNSYRLTASGAFFDALSFVKPIIALKNSFFEYYFNTMGDIGYLCSDYNELQSVVSKLVLNGIPAERYLNQCKNIVTGRQTVEIMNLSARLRGLL